MSILQQGFFIATLASTVAGTFITGINLFDRVNEKRKNRHQKKLDKSQDKRISYLERRLEENDGDDDRQDPDRQRERQHGRIKDDDLRGSLEQGGPMVKQEYDRLYAAMGPRFAEGDCRFTSAISLTNKYQLTIRTTVIAQTQLQSHVITLQSTVIRLLEEALYTGNPPDMTKLYNASEFARIGSINALREQSQRLQQSHTVRRPIGLLRRTSSTPSLHSTTTNTTDTLSAGTSSDRRTTHPTVTGYRSRHPNRNSHGYYGPNPVGTPPRKALTYQRPDTIPYDPNEEYQKSGPLFCPYARDLQLEPRQPLDERFLSPSSSSAPGCPACDARIPVLSTSTTPQLGYIIDKEVVVTERITHPHSPPPRPHSRSGGLSLVLANGAPLTEFVKRFEDRAYLLTARFLVKCHRAGAERGKGYACYLCFTNREKDTLVKTMRGLVGHVRDKHDVGEYEREVDIRDVDAPGRY